MENGSFLFFWIFLLLFAYGCQSWTSIRSLRRCSCVSPIRSTNSSRRTHFNKYQQFSRTSGGDPFVQALEKLKKDQELNNEKLPPGIRLRTLGQAFRFDSNSSLAILNQNFDPSDPYCFGFVQIGNLYAPHGLQGEVRVRISSDFVEPGCVGLNASMFLMKGPQGLLHPVRLKSGRVQVGRRCLLRFEQLESRAAAKDLNGYGLFIYRPIPPVVKAEEGEYLLRDLIGLNVFVNETYQRLQIEAEQQTVATAKTRRGRPKISKTRPSKLCHVGKIQGVVLPEEIGMRPSLAAKMHFILEVRLLRSDECFLVPFVHAIVPEVSLENQSVILTPPKGLIESTYISPDVARDKKRNRRRGFQEVLTQAVEMQENPQHHQQKTIAKPVRLPSTIQRLQTWLNAKKFGVQRLFSRLSMKRQDTSKQKLPPRSRVAQQP